MFKTNSGGLEVRAIDVFEWFVVLVLYIPTILSFIIYFLCFSEIKDKEFKYIIFPLALLVSLIPFLNMLSLMCIGFNCCVNENNVDKDKFK